MATLEHSWSFRKDLGRYLLRGQQQLGMEGQGLTYRRDQISTYTQDHENQVSYCPEDTNTERKNTKMSFIVLDQNSSLSVNSKFSIFIDRYKNTNRYNVQVYIPQHCPLKEPRNIDTLAEINISNTQILISKYHPS